MAQEAARFALLIGNKAYSREVGPLVNPHNDVDLLSAKLAQVGFTVLPIIKDGRRSAILGGVRDLVRRLNVAGPGAVGFLYYSGHGAAELETGINYLIPVDATDPTASTFWDEALKLDDVLRLLAGAREAAKVIVFDACRNELTLPVKSTTKGFVPVADQQGSFIAYASEFGRTASDKGRTSGPYAAALAAEIVKPGLDHLGLFQNVKEAVIAATGGSQRPWESNGLSRRVYLTGREVAPVAPPAPAAPAQQSAAAEAWLVVRETRSAADLEAYLARFGDTFYGDLAKRRLADLKGAQAVAVDRGQPPGPGAAAQPKPSGQGADPMTPSRVFRDCPDVCPEMVVVPAGEFVMGSPTTEERWHTYDGREEPQRTVRIAKPIAVGKFEVTFDEWDICVAAMGCRHSPSDQGWGRGKRPVIEVSWDDAKEYVVWLSNKSGQPYRLLSEAEWEFAARSGTTTPFSTGKTVTPDQANFDGSQTYGGSAKGANRGRTVEVGTFAPNAFGLHDMHGNVWEWVEDKWHSNYQGAPNDGSAWVDRGTSSRVLRGGSSYYGPQFLRSAFRDYVSLGGRVYGIGFRVARTL